MTMGSDQSTTTGSRSDVVLPHALQIPLTNKLSGKRVILASASPRRSQILETLGLRPEVVPSKFKEDLAKQTFVGRPEEYAVQTAMEKAMEVYERLVKESPDDPPDLVIGADTIILNEGQILEKPGSKEENYRMLMDLNGKKHQAVTGVVVVYPQLQNPGYAVKSLAETAHVHFADNPEYLIKAYVEQGEGVDRAGGYAIQGLGGVLVQRIEGDYMNVVGFPGFAFFRFLDNLIDQEEFLVD